MLSCCIVLNIVEQKEQEMWTVDKKKKDIKPQQKEKRPTHA